MCLRPLERTLPYLRRRILPPEELVQNSIISDCNYISRLLIAAAETRPLAEFAPLFPENRAPIRPNEPIRPPFYWLERYRRVSVFRTDSGSVAGLSDVSKILKRNGIVEHEKLRKMCVAILFTV